MSKPSTTDKYEDLPCGLYLMEARFGREGKVGYQLRLKVPGRAWYDEPHVPAYSDDVPGILGRTGYGEFWAWAKRELPVWRYPNPIPAAGHEGP